MTTKVPAVLVQLNGTKNLNDFISADSANPTFPTVAQNLGTAGGITTPISTYTQSYSQLARCAKLFMRVQFTPADLSNVRLVFGIPANWTVTAMSCGVVDTVTGLPVACAQTREGYIYFKPATTNVYWVDVWLELSK